MNITITLTAINREFSDEKDISLRKMLSRYAKAMAQVREKGVNCDLLLFGNDVHLDTAQTSKLIAINAIFLEEIASNEGKKMAQ